MKSTNLDLEVGVFIISMWTLAKFFEISSEKAEEKQNTAWAHTSKIQPKNSCEIVVRVQAHYSILI